MAKDTSDDEVLFLRHGISADDVELREDLSIMFSDMRRQADILRRLPIGGTEESALIFVQEHQA